MHFVLKTVERTFTVIPLDSYDPFEAWQFGEMFHGSPLYVLLFHFGSDLPFYGQRIVVSNS